MNNYKAKCAVGKRGIGHKRREGDLITPVGSYKIKYLLYRKDRVKKIQTKVKKFEIKKNLIYWQKYLLNHFRYIQHCYS